MRGSQLAIFAVIAKQFEVSWSLRLPFRRDLDLRTTSSASVVFASGEDDYNFSVVDFSGDDQIIYVANVTVDGQSYEVQLDTGSSDFWLDTQGIAFSNANNTNLNGTIVYGDTTTAMGNIFIAPVEFGNYSVPKQAFISAPGSNATSDNDRGLLGLGAREISVIYNTLENSSFSGLPLLNNIFNTTSEGQNFITFLLSRSNLGMTDGGIFTIAEVDPNWSAVVNQSKIAIAQDFEQWIGLMDAVIVNGKNYSGHGLLANKHFNQSAINPAFRATDEKNSLLSLFDTGTALGYLPQHYFDAVYKGIKGIETVDESSGLYSLPCDTKLNVSMVFNGTEYPINPLDLTRLVQAGNDTVCVNTFAPGDLKSQGFDFILGDAFLRNTYALFNYGNWTDTSDNMPYVQLLSTTNQSEAWTQFDDLNTARIAQWKSLNGTFNSTQ